MNKEGIEIDNENDGMIAHVLQQNLYDIGKLTKGHIEINEFETVK